MHFASFSSRNCKIYKALLYVWLNQKWGFHCPKEVTATRQPVDTIENEEKKGRDNKEEPVNIDVVVATEVLHWFLQRQHIVRVVLSIWRTNFIFIIVFAHNLIF